MNSQKLGAVEGVRGFACLMVVLSHVSLTFFPYLHNFDRALPETGFAVQSFIYHSPFGFWYSGMTAVFIFFCLSGYILSYAALKYSGQEKNRVVLMSLKRYPRLAIPVLASTVVCWLVFISMNVDKSLLSVWIQSYGNITLSFFDAVRNSLVDVFFLNGLSAYNPVLWTMKIELIGSFIVYSICYFKARMLLLSCLWFILIFLGYGFQKLSGSLTLGLASFIVGMWFYLYGKKIGLVFAITIIILGLYLASFHLGSYSYQFLETSLGSKSYIISHFVAAQLIVYAIIFNSYFHEHLGRKFFLYLGKMSFSAYLLNMPVLVSVGVVAFNFAYSVLGNYISSALIASLVSIVAIYLLSSVFYYCVDSQSIRFSDWFAKTLFNHKIFKSKILKNQPSIALKDLNETV